MRLGWIHPHSESSTWVQQQVSFPLLLLTTLDKVVEVCIAIVKVQDSSPLLNAWGWELLFADDSVVPSRFNSQEFENFRNARFKTTPVCIVFRIACM